MARYTITPWRTQVDLLEVRSQLYQTQETPKRHAIARVHAWKLRGNLPHAVESTALLMDAQLHHRHTLEPSSTPTPAQSSTAAPQASEFSIRAVYTAAFTRFVTGFCDIGRHKERSLEPSSMLRIAQQIGMPEEFVALRHEATHEELPGLRRLVVATEKALQWLWGVYWAGLEESRGEADEESGMEDLSAFKTEARTMLKGWMRTRVKALNKRVGGTQAHADALETVVQSSIGLCNGERRKVEAFVAVLIDEPLIIPDEPENSQIAGSWLVWDSVIFALADRLQGFEDMLLDALLVALSGPQLAEYPRDARKAFSQWALHVIEKQSNQQRALRVSARVIRHCCLYSGDVPQRLGERLLEKSDAGFREAWEDVFAASKLRSAEASDDAPEVTDGSTRVDPAPAEPMVADMQTSIESGWHRAALPPTGPIGVVF